MGGFLVDLDREFDDDALALRRVRAPVLRALSHALVLALVSSASSARAAGAAGAASVPASATPAPVGDASTVDQSAKDKAEEAAEACLPRTRSGVVLSLTLGLGLASSSGYPNNASLIGTRADYSSSPIMTGGGFTFNLMGALTDWVSFGIWFGSETFESKNWKSTGGGGGFRVETFPLDKIYPRLDGLGVFGNFGLGGADLRVTAPGTFPSADGVQSFIGVGALYEWKIGRALGGHFSLGPSLEYDAMYSQALERHGALLGARLAFYGGG
jgi:hypothetical protein